MSSSNALSLDRSWDRRIARAQELTRTSDPAAELLSLYARIAAFQKNVFQDITATGENDPAVVARYFPSLRDLIMRHGPSQSRDFLRNRLQSAEEVADLVTQHWEDPADGAINRDVIPRFFAMALLQPFAESLAGRGQISGDTTARRCPFCAAPPIAAVLRVEGDGGKRLLLCALCGSEWEFRRVLCPNCGEEDKDKLPIYTADELPHVRVEACDRCHTYLKAIDLTKNGFAIPVVDELAGVSLNVWAEENGYVKAEPNLMGL